MQLTRLVHVSVSGVRMLASAPASGFDEQPATGSKRWQRPISRIGCALLIGLAAGFAGCSTPSPATPPEAGSSSAVDEDSQLTESEAEHREQHAPTSAEELPVELAISFSHDTFEGNGSDIVDGVRFWRPGFDAFLSYEHPEGMNVAGLLHEKPSPVSPDASWLLLPTADLGGAFVVPTAHLRAFLNGDTNRAQHHKPPQDDSGPFRPWRFHKWLSECDALFSVKGSGGEPARFDIVIHSFCHDEVVLLSYGRSRAEFQRIEEEPCARKSIDCSLPTTKACSLKKLTCSGAEPPIEAFKLQSASQEGVVVASENATRDDVYLLRVPPDEVRDAERIELRDTGNGGALLILHSEN